MGRRADAVAPAEEAVTLHRDQAAANPAYLPDLAGALNNLGIRYSEVGRRADAVAPTEEAVTLRRDQAAANPAYLPDLAGALNNLGIRYSEVGRRADAVAPAEEAVTLYRGPGRRQPRLPARPRHGAEQPRHPLQRGGPPRRRRRPRRGSRHPAPRPAAANPAYLPDLAMAPEQPRSRYRARTAGLPPGMRMRPGRRHWAPSPFARPQGGACCWKRPSVPPQVKPPPMSWPAVALTPPPAGPTLFRVHAACRELRHRDPDLFDHQWQERLATPQPMWLSLDDTTLTTVGDWLQTPTHLLARDYHLHHADLLARPERPTALDELALLGFDPALIGQYRPLLDADGEQAIRAAYQPLILQETLATWLDADIPDQQRLLADNRDMLLSSQAATLLGQWAAANPGDIALKFGAAMLTLAREGLDSTVLAAADDPEQLGTLLGGLLTAGNTQLLLAATQLLLCLNLDDPTTATAEFYQAAALALTGHTQEATQAVQAAARHDPTSTNRWLSILAQQVPAHPQLAPLIQALVARPPDEPDNTASP